MYIHKSIDLLLTCLTSIVVTSMDHLWSISDAAVQALCVDWRKAFPANN